MLPIRISPSANPMTVIKIVSASALGALGLALIPGTSSSSLFHWSSPDASAAPFPFTAFPKIRKLAIAVSSAGAVHLNSQVLRSLISRL